MAPSRNTVLVVLGLVASIRAIPAALPEPQFGIGPPHYSISWDAPLPVATTDPEEPEEPEYPAPAPSDQISLGQPTATISWDGEPVPTDNPEPEDPEDPEYPEEPEEPLPSPTNIISLNPPSYSISWDGPKPPKPTKKPWPPRPTHKTSTKRYVSASASWDKKQDFSYSISWDGPQPPKTTRKPWPWWPPVWTSTDGYVSASVSWGKRQDEEEPEPTDFPGFPDDPDFPEDPEDPEEPNNPISFPNVPAPTPPNSIGIQPPKVSFSWGKRQEDEPEPTDFPDPEDPEDPNNPISFPGAPAPTPPNSIGIQPPKVSFSWGKRDVAATAPSYGLGKPTASIKVPKPPKTTSKAWISWGKRQDDEGPTEVFPPAPTPSDQITFIQPTASISWGKRDAEAQTPTHGLGFPTFSWGFPPVYPSSAYISWGKRDDEDKKHPTTFLTHKTRPHPTVTNKPTPVTSSCPTVTKTIVPPCIPPTCPHDLVSCKVSEAQVLEDVQVREVEKTIVTITTVAKPSGKPTPTKSVCTTSTVVVNLGCPTWTCVPWDEGCAV